MWRKPTIEVCHTCELYDRIYGTHPQTGEAVDYWGCALNRLAVIGLETAKASAATGDAVQAHRNDQARERQAQSRLLMSRQIGGDSGPPRLVDYRPPEG